jgi:hypothetical protein
MAKAKTTAKKPVRARKPSFRQACKFKMPFGGPGQMGRTIATIGKTHKGLRWLVWIAGVTVQPKVRDAVTAYLANEEVQQRIQSIAIEEPTSSLANGDPSEEEEEGTDE